MKINAFPAALGAAMLLGSLVATAPAQAGGGGNITQESAGGIILWPKLTYTLSDKAQPAAQ